jgi:DNA-binding GntR family transcriptional regulator
MEVIGLTKSVAQYLRDYIITGDLAPGQKLNELELSSRLNVSRPPLREAFRLLENEHLVISIPRKGCYVTELSMQDCRQIFEAREMIECYAVELFKAKNIRDMPDVESALSATSDFWTPSYDKQEKAIRHNPFPHFHIKLIESSGNRWVIHFHKSITSSLARYQFMCTYVPGVPDQAQEEHEQIFNFIKRGNYDLAKEYLRSHIASMFSYIEQILMKQRWPVSDVI